MNNIERQKMARNKAKEEAREEPYEIPIEMGVDREGKIKAKKFAEKIFKEAKESGMSYLEINEALYLADTALRNAALQTRMFLRNES